MKDKSKKIKLYFSLIIISIIVFLASYLIYFFFFQKTTLIIERGDQPTIYIKASKQDSILEVISKINNPPKKGYQFLNWVFQNGQQITKEDKCYKSQKVKPVWKEKEYKVIYNNISENKIVEKSLRYTDNIVKNTPKEFLKMGYKIDYLINNKNIKENTKVIDIDTDIIKVDLNITTINYHIYYNYFDTNNNPVTYNINETVKLENANKNGFKFIGWYNNKDLTGKKINYININKDSFGDIQLYPKFEYIDYKIKYENCDNLENPNPKTYTIDDEIKFKPVTKKWHIFKGFYDNEKFLGEPIINIAKGSINNLTVYAKFEKSKSLLHLEKFINGTYEIHSTENIKSTANIEVVNKKIYVKNGYLSKIAINDTEIIDYTYKGENKYESADGVIQYLDKISAFSVEHNKINISEEIVKESYYRNIDNYDEVTLNGEHVYILKTKSDILDFKIDSNGEIKISFSYKYNENNIRVNSIIKFKIN